MVKIETKLPKETKKKTKTKNDKRTRFTVFLVLGILLIFALAFGYWAYRTVMSPNVTTPEGKEAVIYIPTGSDYEAVKNILSQGNFLANEKSFNWVAQRKDRPDRKSVV